MRLHMARMKLREIVFRACTNPDYIEELRARPVEVLVGEGLPYDVIEDFLRETSMQAEVSGYAVLQCANSCALSSPAAYPEALLHNE